MNPVTLVLVVAEVAIPFKTLGFKPGSTRWGFQAMRIIKRKGETGFLVNATRNRSPFDLSDLAILEGLEGIDKGVGNA